MALIASQGDSCSQTRTTVQPARSSDPVSARSRSTFLWNFASQKDAFARGRWPCAGQACQKQPSTKIATRRLVKTISGRTRRSAPSTRKSTRNLHPLRCNAVRIRRSGDVSLRRFARMVADASGLEGAGRSLTRKDPEFVSSRLIGTHRHPGISWGLFIRGDHVVAVM